MKLSKIRCMLEDSGVHKLLFVVHPSMAIDNWSHDRVLDELSDYYKEVISTVNGFDGDVIITNMKPYMMQTAGDGNIKEYQNFMKWLDNVSSKPNVHLFNEKGKAGECIQCGGLIDDILLSHDIVQIYVGGGYFGHCLLSTLKAILKNYGTYIRGKPIMLDNITYVPGSVPHRLDKEPQEEGQASYTKKLYGDHEEINQEFNNDL